MAEEYHDYKDVEWLKEQVRLGKTQREIAKECGCHQYTIYKYLDLERANSNRKIYDLIHKEKLRKQKQINYQKSRERIFDILGKQCKICGEKNYNFLTLDPINNDGYLDRKEHKSKNWGIILFIKKLGYPEELIKEKFQVLCYNCNCSKTKRISINLPLEKQTKDQKYRTKLWKEALDFFGPCSCGSSNLKHLTIGHIHNDGNVKRKNGEKFGKELLLEFRKLGWPEFLKKDYFLQCYNCNCSQGKTTIDI